VTQVGSIKDLQSNQIQPYPYGQYPYGQPVWTYVSSPSSDGYANEVEVERREHDAVLTFWRLGPKNGKQRIAQITVPLSVLKSMEETS
jgi:hypothetical protein